MPKLEKFEIAEFGPFRLIGKTLYAPPHSGELFGDLWGNSKAVFAAIDKLAGYSTDETSDIAYLNWDAEKGLLGYTVGRFMKINTPIPDGLDHIDIPAQFVAKSLVSGEFSDMISEAPKLTEEAIKKQDTYTIAWSEKFVGAEVYTKDTIAKEGIHSVLGYYIPCKKVK